MRKPFLLFTVVVSALLVACGAVLAQAWPRGKGFVDRGGYRSV